MIKTIIAITQKQERDRFYSLRHPEKVKERWMRFYDRNKTEILKRSKQNREQYPGGYSALGRKWKYGMSQDNFNQRLEDQNYRCAFCGELFGGKKPSVDHNHITGQVRALVHQMCNVKIGILEDNRNYQRLKDYLDQYAKNLVFDIERRR